MFDRVWALRTAQVENGASLLAGDFGFKEAIATGHDETIASALENLRRRLGVDAAFLVREDGRVVMDDEAPAPEGMDLAAPRRDGTVSGVMLVHHMPYEVVSTPVLAPLPIGWVVFASRIDRPQMRLLEQLSAIPLDASIAVKDPSGGWSLPSAPAP